MSPECGALTGGTGAVMVIKGNVQMRKQWESPALFVWESSVFAEVAHPTWTGYIQPGDSALAMLP